MQQGTGDWVLTTEGLVAAPTAGARRQVRRLQVALDDQPLAENALLLLVALLPLLLAVGVLVGG